MRGNFVRRLLDLSAKGWKSFSESSYNLMIIPAIASYCLFQNYVVSISSSEGDSMEPTIRSGDILIIDRWMYKWRGLQKGDIIVATQPVNPAVNICKRVIEKGGATLEKYAIEVPENFYWVEGDNSEFSYDSRHHGATPANLIKGKVIHVIHI